MTNAPATERTAKDKRSGHRQRLRDKFLRHGLEAFTDSEVVEMLLAMGTPRRDTKEPARHLLARFGSLSGVLEAEPHQLTEVPGVGANNSFAIGFIHQVARRYLRRRVEGRPYLTSSRAVIDYLTHELRHRPRESLYVIHLDGGHAVIDLEELFAGTVNRSAVYPREVVRSALARNAAAIVVAHNHPSGRATPSEQDIALTGRLHQACSLVDIRLLDHVIIGEEPYSFADHGLMATITAQYPPP